MTAYFRLRFLGLQFYEVSKLQTLLGKVTKAEYLDGITKDNSFGRKLNLNSLTTPVFYFSLIVYCLIFIQLFLITK